MRCLTSSKYTMLADILRQGRTDDPTPPTPVPTDTGTWVDQQDPLTGEIVRVWTPGTPETRPDNPDTPGIELNTIDVMVRGIVGGGIVGTGSGERWDDIYQSLDYARAWFAGNIVLSKRDRLFNIRDKASGAVLWKEEEQDPDQNGDYRATEFEVVGITPIFDPFGRLVENMAFLQRAEVQTNA